MGQQNSTSGNYLSSKFQLVEKNHTLNTTILKEKNSQQFFIMKQITLNNTEDFIRLKQKFNQKKKINNQHHQALIQFHTRTQSTFCSNLHKIIIIYQYVNHNLLQQIHARQKQNRPFEQKQIWSILCSITLAMSQLQSLNFQHRSIQPENIYITQDGVIKIADPQLISQSQNILVDINKYYSPQMLSYLEGKSVQINSYKSDMFCLGLCILHASLLQPCYDCFEYQQLYVKTYKLKQKIRIIRNNYSQQLMTTIQLILQSEQRPDFLQLEQYLKKIMQDDLRDFNYSDMQQSKISQKRQRSILLLKQLQQKPKIKQEDNQRDPVIQKLRQLDNQRKTNLAFDKLNSNSSNCTQYNNNKKILINDKITMNNQKSLNQNNNMTQTILVPYEIDKIDHSNNGKLPIIYKQEGILKINKNKLSNNSIENKNIDSQNKDIPKNNNNTINNIKLSQTKFQFNTKPTLTNANYFINNNNINSQSNVITNIKNMSNFSKNIHNNHNSIHTNNSNNYKVNPNSNTYYQNNFNIKYNTNNYLNNNNNKSNNVIKNNTFNNFNNKIYQKNSNNIQSIKSQINVINSNYVTPNVNYGDLQSSTNKNKFNQISNNPFSTLNTNKYQNKNYTLTNEIKLNQQKNLINNNLSNKYSKSNLGSEKMEINKRNSNEKIENNISNSSLGFQKMEKNKNIGNSPFNKINILNNNESFSHFNEKNKSNQIKESIKQNQQKNIYYLAHLKNQSKCKLDIPLIHAVQTGLHNKQIHFIKSIQQPLFIQSIPQLINQKYTNSNLINIKQSDYHKQNDYFSYINNNNLQMNNKPYIDDSNNNNTYLNKYNVLKQNQKLQPSQIKFENTNNQHTLLSFNTVFSPMNDMSSFNTNEISSYHFDQEYKNKLEKAYGQKMQRLKQNNIDFEKQKKPIIIRPISNNSNQNKYNIRFQKQFMNQRIVRNNDKNYMDSCRLAKQISFKSTKYAQKMNEDLPDCQFPQKGINCQTSNVTHIPDQNIIQQTTQFQTQRNKKDNQQSKDFQGKNSESNCGTQRKKMPNYIIEEYKQGARYQGWKLNGLRQGHGKFYYQDGGLYSGMWKQNKMHGHGILYYSNGQPAYDGQWKDDKFHGIGALFNQAPEELQDSFDYTDFDKIGNYWIRYQGEFVQDNKQGNGRLFLTNGQVLQGQFLNDDINGHGQYYLNSGQIIDGYWQNNKLIL